MCTASTHKSCWLSFSCYNHLFLSVSSSFIFLCLLLQWSYRDKSNCIDSSIANDFVLVIASSLSTFCLFCFALERTRLSNFNTFAGIYRIIHDCIFICIALATSHRTDPGTNLKTAHQWKKKHSKDSNRAPKWVYAMKITFARDYRQHSDKNAKKEKICVR